MTTRVQAFYEANLAQELRYTRQLLFALRGATAIERIWLRREVRGAASNARYWARNLKGAI